MQQRREKGGTSSATPRRSRKNPARRTSWGRVLLLFLIGVTVSLQIGKVPGQLPAIESELGLSLFNVGLIVSRLPLPFTVAVAGNAEPL